MIGDIIAAGGNLLSGMMNSNANENAAAANQANWQTSMAYQDLVNKNTIQWKVQDAIKAGLHPLAALGVNTAGGPVSAPQQQPNTAMGDAVNNMGQNIARAVNATSSQQKRVEAYTRAVQAQDLETRSLQNDLLRSRIAQINANTNPPVPTVDQRYGIDGQQPTQPLATIKPLEIPATEAGRGHQEPASIPDVGYANTGTGYAPVPAEKMKERIEDDFIHEKLWQLRNLLVPTVGGPQKPPNIPLKEGYEWRWYPLQGEYRQAIKKPGHVGRYRFWD